MGNYYAGGMVYTDDITMLTPTRSLFKVLVEICEQYADDYCIKFIGAKRMYLVSRGFSCKLDTRVNSSIQDAEHLGHHIPTINKDSPVAKFWIGYYMFMGDFFHIKTAAKCKSFKQCCCSYYGAPLRFLQSKSVGNIRLA